MVDYMRKGKLWVQFLFWSLIYLIDLLSWISRNFLGTIRLPTASWSWYASGSGGEEREVFMIRAGRILQILFLEANECCDHLVLFEGTLGGNRIAEWVLSVRLRNNYYANNLQYLWRESEWKKVPYFHPECNESIVATKWGSECEGNDGENINEKISSEVYTDHFQRSGATMINVMRRNILDDKMIEFWSLTQTSSNRYQFSNIQSPSQLHAFPLIIMDLFWWFDVELNGHSPE